MLKSLLENLELLIFLLPLSHQVFNNAGAAKHVTLLTDHGLIHSAQTELTLFK